MDEALLEAFERSVDGEADEVTMAVLVARLLDPQVEAGAVRQRIDELAREQSAHQDPWDHLRELGFRGNSEDYGALDNSNLWHVLETRRGIPITLAVVLIALARRAGREAVGLNFPGHFLVRVDEVLVDPFEMQAVSRERCLERLPAAARELPREQLFAPASPLALTLRMLNNLKLAFSREGEWSRALDTVDAQLKLAPREPNLHLERGELWRRVGLAEPARDAFRAALALADTLVPDDARRVRDAAQAGLEQLGGASDVVH